VAEQERGLTPPHLRRDRLCHSVLGAGG
jgi:hypothetical protein